MSVARLSLMCGAEIDPDSTGDDRAPNDESLGYLLSPCGLAGG